jgi:hypothetical protein
LGEITATTETNPALVRARAQFAFTAISSRLLGRVTELPKTDRLDAAMLKTVP